MNVLQIREQALQTVARIRALHKGNKELRSDALADASLALQRLWIDLGNKFEAYRRLQGADARSAPYKRMRGARNFYAHVAIEEVVARRLWHDSQSWIDQIGAHVELWREPPAT